MGGPAGKHNEPEETISKMFPTDNAFRHSGRTFVTMSSKRAAQSAIIIGTVILLTLSMYQFHPARQAGMSIMDLEKIAFSKKPSANATPPMEARQISASELMERPLPTDLTRITKIFHVRLFELMTIPSVHYWEL